LGLSLVWHILKLHGGNVQIESKEGRGTAVTISLLDEPSSGSGGDI
jgi:two-component system, OmpR family, sensor histidine kinase SenX3